MRRLLAAALVCASALAVLPAAPALAAAPTASLVVAPLNGGIVGGGDLDVDVTVTNTGDGALPAGELAFSLNRAPEASSSALLAEIARPSSDLLGKLTLTRKRTPRLAAGTSATVRARIDEDDLNSILSAASGARLLYVRLVAGEVRQVAESSIVRMSKRIRDRIGFSTVIPITAPANTRGLVDTDSQAALSGPGGAWTAALEAASAAPTATVALDPQVPASIRLAGAAAPAPARSFLEGLAALPNPVVQLPYGDTDITLASAAGAPFSLSPTSFDGASTAPAALPGATPTATATPVPTAPAGSVGDLTRWDWSSQQLRWPVPGTTTKADVRSARNGLLLLRSGDVKDSPERVAAGPLARVGAARALVADDRASALLRRAAAGGRAGAAAVAPLVGLLATDLVSGSAPAVLAVPGRGADLQALADVLTLLGRQRWVRTRSTEELATARKPAAVDLDPGRVPAGRIATARDLLAGERTVRDLGVAVTDPGVVTGPQRLALLGLLSTGWRGQDQRWRAAAAEARRGFRDVVGMVRIERGSDFTAPGNDGSLRVSVRNDLPRPVEVDVHAQASNARLRFTRNGTTRVTVPPDSSRPGAIGFRSITNGSTTVSLTLTTARGAALGGPVDRDVAVRAGFDTAVAIVLLTLLSALLALGVYRNVRRRSRPRTAAA